MRPSSRLIAAHLRTLVLGVISLILYVLLFTNQQLVLTWSTSGEFSFLVPIAIAFALSFVHGGFTGGFWDMFGLKAKTRKEPRRWNK